MYMLSMGTFKDWPLVTQYLLMMVGKTVFPLRPYVVKLAQRPAPLENRFGEKSKKNKFFLVNSANFQTKLMILAQALLQFCTIWSKWPKLKNLKGTRLVVPVLVLVLILILQFRYWYPYPYSWPGTHTRTRNQVLVPVIKYSYPYSWHRTRTRTRTHDIVLVPVLMTSYSYLYPYSWHCTRTRTHDLVLVPVLMTLYSTLLIPSSHIHDSAWVWSKAYWRVFLNLTIVPVPTLFLFR